MGAKQGDQLPTQAVGVRSVHAGVFAETDAPEAKQESASLPPLGSWEQRPVLLRELSQPQSDASTTEVSDGVTCPIGQPFDIDTNLFEGKALFRLRDLEASHDHSADSDYFDGRKRLFQVVIQGRFKKEMPVSAVICGAEYSKPLKVKPPRFIMSPLQALIRRSAPGIEIDLLSDSPKLLSNFAGCVQTVRVDEKGSEPPITSLNIVEDTKLFGGVFAEKEMPRNKRKKFFSTPANAKEHNFDPSLIYTFDHYDDVMDLTSFQLKLHHLFRYDLEKVVDDPFQYFAKAKSEEGSVDYLWNFHLWHERLVQGSSTEQEEEAVSGEEKFRKSAPF